MYKNSNDVRSIIFQISYDSKKFSPILILNSSEINRALDKSNTIFTIVSNMFTIAKKVIDTSKVFYRINIQLEDEILSMTDNASADESLFSGSTALIIGSSNKKFRNYSTLTSKEKQILKLLSEKCKQGKIISEMRITLNTFKTHKKNIYSKMEFKDRDALLDWVKMHPEFFG